MLDFKEIIINEAKKSNLKITTAESITGGMIASSLVWIPGASEVFIGGFITYTNKMKEVLLKVRHETIEQYGVVSQEVAEQMAKGAIKATGADIALSITGNAGPTVQDNKPIGLVYMSIVFIDKVYNYQFLLDQKDRNSIRMAAASQAISELSKLLISFNRNNK